MRRILIVIMLVCSASVMLPGTASAHELPQTGGCANCAKVAAGPGTDQTMTHDCHNGAACVLCALPAGGDTPVPSSIIASVVRMETPAMRRSAMVAQDLPPPKS